MKVTDLFSVQTLAQILARGLAIATEKKLPVTSWRPGDPSRVWLNFVGDVLSTREDYSVEFMKGGFLDDAEGPWLQYLAKELYGVGFDPATGSAPTVTVVNTGGGYYDPGPGDLTFKSTASNKTFHNTDAPTPLAPGATVTYSLVSDGVGSDYSVADNEIDALVTTLLKVEVISSTASTATDEQEDEPLREQCRATTAALSPNGPPDVYEYVARNHALTGDLTVTKARSIPNSSTGRVYLYLAGADGAVLGPAVALVQAAIERWATPLCIRPTALSATAVAINLAAAVTGDNMPAGFAATVAAVFPQLIAGYGIGVKVTRSMMIAFLQALAEAGGASNVSVALSSPAADVVLATNEVAAPGTVGIT